MTTGLLDWGQAGNYNAVNDRLVIRALAGAQFGLVAAPTLAAGSGLAVNVGPWLAIVDCGDGTSAVIGNTASSSINETAGGASQRTDVLWADINVDGTSQWSLSWLPSPVTGRTGVALGTAVVPASAATAAAMTFAPGGLTPFGGVSTYTDTSIITQAGSATAWGNISKLWSIPANQLVPGDLWELESVGQGTWSTGGTNMGLSVGHSLNGASGSRYIDFGAQFLGSALNFGIRLRVGILIVSATQIINWTEGAISVAAPNVVSGGSNTNASGFVSNSGTNAITAGQPFTTALQSYWRASSGGATVSWNGSRLTRRPALAGP